MCDESNDHDEADPERDRVVEQPIEDILSFRQDPVDFMSAQSFPASDPPPAQ